MEEQAKKHGKFVSFWLKVLNFFKLLNHNNQLSLTNIAFWIFLYKISVADLSQMSVGELATALSVVGLYFGTKMLNKGIENTVASNPKLETAKTLVSTIANTISNATKTDAATPEEENGDC